MYLHGMKMLVTALPSEFDKYDLQRLFNPYGWVAFSKIYMDPITGKSRRRGLVEITDDVQAQKAMDALQGKVVGANPINIKEVKDKNR